MDTITNYTIKSELGQGGMATVYLAEDKKFLTNVAVKVLAKEFAHNENIRKRFLAEARNMFKMSHPNIIKVTDLIEEGDTVAFVMEYIEGDTLKDYLERKGKLNDDDLKAIFTQILAAVAYVHEQGLIHRDIKPSNFMISPKGQVKLLDFGIAKNTDTNSAEYTQTSTSQQMGTPLYMSPEQVNETKSVTAQSDIYSLGVVLWQMVMGQKPYDTKTLSNFQLQSKIVNENLALTNTNWDTSIQKATHKSLESRYTSAQLFLNDLQNPKSIKDDKTVFEKNDDKTIFENKVSDDEMLVEQLLKKKSTTSTQATNEQTYVNQVKYENVNEVKTDLNKKMFAATFKFNGRIRRTEYGLSVIISLFLNLVTMGIATLVTLPFLFAQGCKRCHDINKSGWFQLIPFFGFWMLFVEGDKKSNQYGEPPK
jgi:serine/threonine protein kinase